MRKIDLVSIRISNFKGIRSLSVDLDGHDAVFSGANATGKTSVYDAFLWLLFGKNSAGATKFDFKPLDESGAEIHNLDTSVEAQLRIDGMPHTLRRVNSELWSRPRGKVDHVYGGNHAAFWVDDVPKGSDDFKAYVDSLVSEDVFRLITSHAAFNALMMADRRKALIAISGVNVEAALSAEFPGAAAILAGNTPEEAKIRLRERRKRLNADLDAVPTRIDELTKTLGSVDEAAKREAEYNIADYTQSLARVDDMIAERRAADPVEAAKARLSAVQREMASIEREVEQRRAHALRDAQDALRRAERDRDDAVARRTDLEKRIAAAEREVAEKTQGLEWMRGEYRKEAEKPYQTGEIGTVCPTCGQALPPDQVDTAKAKDRQNFDTAKDKKLNEIGAQGRRLKTAVEEEQSHAEKLRKELTHWTGEVTRLTTAAAAARTAYDAVVASTSDLPPEHASLRDEAAKLKETIATPGEDKQLREFQERRVELQGKIARHQATLAAYTAAETTRRRIEALTVEQRALGDKLAEVDRQMIELEQYVSARGRLLEEGINAKFPTVRWRLFNQLNNTGIEDACDCLIPSPNGAMAAYHNSANTGAKINAGLEIINVLCDFYGVAAPIFIDNAESVNKLIPTAGQQIQLVVTDGKELRIEVKEAA